MKRTRRLARSGAILALITGSALAFSGSAFAATIGDGGASGCDGWIAGNTAYASCNISGSWALDVYCNFDPFLHRVYEPSGSAGVIASVYCWQGVNQGWIEESS